MVCILQAFFFSTKKIIPFYSEVRSYFLLYELARGFSVMESKFPLGFYPITRARCHVGLRIPDDLDIPPEYSEKFAVSSGKTTKNKLIPIGCSTP